MKHIYLLFSIASIAFIISSCTVEVNKITEDLDPASLRECSNGAINHPTCNRCRTGQDLNPNNICVDLSMLDCITGLGKRLQWDSYQDPNATGFKLYRSEDRINFTVVGNPITPTTTTTYTLVDESDELTVTLFPCVTNWLRLTAFGPNNLESEPSNDVCWGIGCPE